MNCYLLTFHYTSLSERQVMLNFLDTVPEVLNWRAVSGAIFIISSTLTFKIHKGFPALNFFLTPVFGTNINGWADMETWDFISNPKSSSSMPSNALQTPFINKPK
jgi:hypothetical protein